MNVHRFALVVAGATLLLIIAGGLVTSTESGLAVPDWPLSYGMLFPPMVGGVLYEHSHRMIAGVVALLAVVLALWLRRVEPRRWVRQLGALSVLAVLLQATLGGLTVLLLLPPGISIAHACLAQAFFCLVVTLVVVTRPEWKEPAPRLAPEGRPSLRALATATTGAVFVQLVLGATVRHADAGLAIRDYPLAMGRLVPPLDDPRVVVHFAHRVWAVVVSALAAATIARVLRRHGDDDRLASPATLLALLLVFQIFLGASIVWSARAIPATVAHVAVGALTLATSLTIALEAARSARAAVAAAPLDAPGRAASRATRPERARV